MFDFFTEESKLVEHQVYLIENGFMEEDDVLPFYNLREVVSNVLSKRNSVVNETNTNNMEGGD